VKLRDENLVFFFLK